MRNNDVAPRKKIQRRQNLRRRCRSASQMEMYAGISKAADMKQLTKGSA